MPIPQEPKSADVPATSEREATPPEAVTENGSHSDGATSPTTPNGDTSKPTKIFVGGLSWQTSSEKLEEYFARFGEVVECNIMRDASTRRSRGFGFITFRDPASVSKVLEAHAQEPIVLDEKNIDPKIAVPPKRPGNKVMSPPWTAPSQTKRIFVGGLSSDSTETDLQDYFKEFGTIQDVQLMYDRNTSRHRGFGFVTFDLEKPAEKVCSIQYHDIKGKKVEVKVAQSKEALAMQGKGRFFPTRPPYVSYDYPSQAAYQYYPGPYPIADYYMGGYSAPPVMLPGGKMRGKGRSFAPYTPGYSYPYPEQQMNAYNYYGIHPHMMAGTGHLLEHMIPPSPMTNQDYMAEQFQGMTLNNAYSTSPLNNQYSQQPMLHKMESQAGNNSTGSPTTEETPFSPQQALSPKGANTSTARFTGSQVSTYTGNPNSFAVAQATY